MAEQRQPFRFRLPWLSAARPTAQPTRPTAQPQPPPRPQAETQSSTIPVQRPPFRPAGIAPVQPPPLPAQAPPRAPPPALAPARAEPQQPSPPRAISESRPQAPSPARATSESQVTSQPASPSQPKTQTTFETVPKSQTQPPTEITLQPSDVAAKSVQESSQPTESAPTSKATVGIPAATEKSDSISTTAKRQTLPSESEKESKKTEEQKDAEEVIKEEKAEGKKVVEVLEKEKIKGLAHKEPVPKATPEPTLMTPANHGKETKVESATHPKVKKPVISHGERAPLHKEIREDISKLVHNLASGHSKLPMDEKSVSIITVAGENRGAIMHIGQESAKKDRSVHIHRGYKLNSDESPETTTDTEGKSEKPTIKEGPATSAYINSNAESINSSIIFNSSINERNPGVQLEFSHIPAEAIKSSTKPESLETRKSEFNVTQAERLTYEPIVKRRCLRGLFMEPSDSDPDDPTKPRRHGCRYNSCQKIENMDIGVL